MPRLFRFVVGLAILLAVPAASWAQFQNQQTAAPRIRQQSPPPPPQSGNPPIADERGTEKSPLMVRTLPSDEEIARELQTRRDRAFNNYVMIFLGGAVAILALLQLATFIVMLRTGRSQLRAYVQVSSAKIYNAFEGKGGPIAAHITIKNFGQTPARQVMSVSALAVEKYPPASSNFVVSDKEFSAPGRSRTSLAPGQTEETVEVAHRPALDEQEQRALIDGQLAIFVYGEIRFSDVFGRSQRTKYRYMLGGSVGVRSGGSLVACED